MKKVLFSIALMTGWVLFADDLSFFHNVTNLWFQGDKSNVLSIAQERLACNSNDIAGAILKMEYDLEYLNLDEISNSIIRVDNIIKEIHTPNLLNEQERFPFFLDKILTLFTNQEMYADLEADRAKALLPEKRMSFERMLSAVCLDGLVTNNTTNPQ
jgi:hypothetical protein